MSAAGMFTMTPGRRTLMVSYFTLHRAELQSDTTEEFMPDGGNKLARSSLRRDRAPGLEELENPLPLAINQFGDVQQHRQSQEAGPEVE